MAPSTGDWRARAAALVQAGRDLSEAESTFGRAPADYRHAALRGDYLMELREAKRWADSWWRSVVETELQRSDEPVEAKRRLAAKYPAGPAAHGSVIAVLRKYWLACVALNENSVPKTQMPPEEFLLGSLVDSPELDLAELISGLPYWPIGVDADGKWV
jgi:hypothetical protein